MDNYNLEEDWAEIMKDFDYKEWHLNRYKNILILDDYRPLLSNSTPNKDVLDLFKLHKYNVDIQLIDHETGKLKSISEYFPKNDDTNKG